MTRTLLIQGHSSNTSFSAPQCADLSGFLHHTTVLLYLLLVAGIPHASAFHPSSSAPDSHRRLRRLEQSLSVEESHPRFVEGPHQGMASNATFAEIFEATAGIFDNSVRENRIATHACVQSRRHAACHV